MATKLLLSLAYILAIFVSIRATAQISGDYRTNGTGTSWTTASNWDRFNGTSWVAGTSYPGQNAPVANTTVTIRDGHTIVLLGTPTNSIVNLVIGGGTSGILNIGQTANNSYTLTCSGTVTINSGGSLLSAGNTGGTHTLNFQSSLTNNGTINFASGTDQVTMSVTGSTINTGTITFGLATGVKTFTGGFSNSGTFTSTAITSTANLIFKNGATTSAGTFSAGSATFNTTVNQTIGGAGAMTFDNDVTISVDASLTGAGDFTVAGVMTLSNGTTDLTNNKGSVTLSNTAAAALTGTAGASWIQGANSTLSYAGSTITNITLTATTNTPNTVNYTGATATILPVNYNNLSYSGTTTGTITSASISGNITSNTGQFTSTGTITFNGTGSQTISGTGTCSFTNLTLSTTTTSAVTVNHNISVSGLIQFTAANSRVLAVGTSGNITLGTTATFANNDTDSYIQLDGLSGPNSNLIRTTDATVTPWATTFPVGTSIGGYTPVTIPIISTAPANNSTLGVKSIVSNNQIDQLKRTFRFTVSNNINSTYFSNAVFTYIDPTDISSGDTEAEYTTPWKYEAGGAWGVTPGSVNSAANTFTVTGGSLTNAPLNTGTYFFTIASGVDNHHAWYSYQNGDFDQPDTWTLDPSGTSYDNGLLRYPQDGDEIHILNGFTVRMNLSNRSLYSTEISGGGTLNMSTTTGQNLGIVTGTGLLRMNGNNLPNGTYTDFVTSSGGTIEYYDVGGTLPTFQTSYNNLMMTNSTGSAITYIQASNLTVNGNFSLSATGAGTVTWQINDASNLQRTITLNGDLTVGSSGKITVGTGNEESTAQHTLTIYGNITNSGVIKFYDPTEAELNEADYGLTYPTTGVDLHRNELQGNAVSVTFAGTSNTTVTCNNTTDFYRFILNKGTGQQSVLTVNSSNTSYFRLFGPSNIATTEVGNTWEYISNNALSIVNGTLQLTGSINIPNLTIGMTSSDYFPIPRNGVLWLNGSNVTVKISDDTPDVYSGDKDGRILMSGMLRITAGTLNDGFSKGLGSQDGGSYFQEGGTVTCWQFRPRATGTGVFSFTQTGGTLNVGYNYVVSGGKVDTYEEDYCRFDLRSPNCTFQMSGTAILNVAKPTNTAVNNGGLFRVSSSTGNYNVSGGTVNLYMGYKTATASYPGIINTTAPLYNLNIYEESATTETAQLSSNSLVVLNNLTLNTGNNPSFVTNDLNVTVGGNFTINANTTYTPGTGKTTFNGTGAQTWTNSGNISSLGSVVVSKTIGSVLTISGSLPTIATALTLTSGTLDDGGNTITVSGTGILTNNAVHTGTGAIDYTSTATTILGSSGTFGNLNISTNASISLAGDQTVTGNLRLINANSTLNIGAYELKALGNIYSNASPGTGVAFTETKRIMTNGLHNAGGLTRQGAASVLFPVGVLYGSNLYTPNTINVSATSHTNATITVRPVASEHPNVTTTNISLAFYWRVTSTYTVANNVTSVTHGPYTWGSATASAPKNGTIASYQAARYDRTANTWATNSTIFSATFTIQPNPFNTNSGWTGVSGSQLDGEYTCGVVTAFGTVKVFYSKATGNWNESTTWSNASVGGAAITPAGNTTAGTHYPGPNNPVVIGDGATNNHIVTTVANSSCGALTLNTGSTLDCSTFTGHNFGTTTGGLVTGRGRLRLAATGAGVVTQFPKGDFTNFLGATGGTVEWYGATKTIPVSGPTPQSLSLATYYNLVINPNAGATITLPASNLTIYNDFIQGDTVGYSGTVIPNGTQTISIGNNLKINRGAFNFTNASTSVSTITASGNVIITSNGTMAVTGAGTTANANTITIPGGFTNNGTATFKNSALVNLIFTGSNNVNITGTGATTFNLVTINKTNSSNSVTLKAAGAVTATTANWLVLTNGIFDFFNAGSHTLVPAASTNTYSIPPTATLRVSSGTVNITASTSNAGDLLLSGTLEVAGGSAYVGNTTAGNDIEYASAGTPTINVTGGALYVSGSIRRSTSTITGALVYKQSNASTVTVYGNSSDATRGVFEIDYNTGSVFNLLNTATLWIQKQTNGTGYADLFINPVTSSVDAGATISVGLPSTTAQTNFRINIAPTIGNFSITDGTGNAQSVYMYSNSLKMNGNLSIPTPSVLTTNSLDVSIGGNLLLTGTYTGGTNTTTFTGSNNPQTASLSSTSSFNNITVSKTSGTTLSVSGTSPNLNNLNILTGILDVGDLNLNVSQNVTNNSQQTGNNGAIVILSTNSNTNTITSTNGIFHRLTLGGTATSKVVTVSGNMSITKELKFSSTNRYLMIGSNRLTFESTASAVSGAGSTAFIRTNGVSSDLGVTRNWPTGVSTFVYPIGASNNYTPVSFNLNVTSTGPLTIIPVNSAHVTRNQSSDDRILNFYWIVSRGSALLATTNGSHTYTYPSSLITGTDVTPGLVAGYLDATASTLGWTTSGHGGSATTTVMTFTTGFPSNIPAAGKSYDYTVGTAGATGTLPNPIQPLYSRIGVATVADLSASGGGRWTTASNWTVDSDGDPNLDNPSTVTPVGVPVVILSGTKINTFQTGQKSYKTTINGILDNGSTIGHNLGTIDGTGTFRTATNTFPAGDYTAFVASTGGTIEYVAPMAMNNRGTYNNLSVYSGSSGTVTMTNTDLILNGNMTIPSGVTLNNASNRNITIAGNWSNSGTFTAGSGTVAFNGSVDQSIVGTTAFNSLTVSKTGNLNLTGTAATTVNGTLTMTNGYLVPTATHPLTISSTGTTSGGSSSSYISGLVTKVLNSGSVILPIGKLSPGRYRPVTLANPSGADTWTAEYFGHGATSDGYNVGLMNTTNIRTVSTWEYWMVSRSGTTSADLSLSYNTGSYTPPNIGTVANLRVARWNGAQWDVPPGSGTHSQSGDNISGTVTVTNVTSFSPETLASTDDPSPLPVTWISFTGARDRASVELRWVVSQQIDNDRFEVERSLDGKDFVRIGTVKGGGTSYESVKYTYTDNEAVNYKKYYYRIKQIDLDGKYDYSKIVVLLPEGESSQRWFVYPNPVKNTEQLVVEDAKLQANNNVEITIFSSKGQEIFRAQGSIESLNQRLQNVSPSINSGLYVIRITDGKQIEHFRLVHH
jgi:fibronectin-binding autotransporter adhesin